MRVTAATDRGNEVSFYCFVMPEWWRHTTVDALALVAELLGYVLHLLALPGCADLLRKAASVMRHRLQHPKEDDSSLFFEEGSSCRSLYADSLAQTFNTSRRLVTYILSMWTVHLIMLSLAAVFDWRWYPQSDGTRTPTDTAARQHISTCITLLVTVFMRSQRWCATTLSASGRRCLHPRRFDRPSQTYLFLLCPS